MASIGTESPGKTLKLMVEMEPTYSAALSQLSLVVGAVRSAIDWYRGEERDPIGPPTVKPRERNRRGRNDDQGQCVISEQ